VLAFFGLAALICAAIVFWYTRCIRSTLLVMACSLIAVVWQLGMLPLLGYSLDPYAVLVPFLVFAIGMSHGAQKMNGIMQDIGRGMSRLVAARFTFRRLFMAGFTALACDAVGFAVLMMLDIHSIRRLATTASLGVAILVFTNLIVLPVLLSYTGVSERAARRAAKTDSDAGGPPYAVDLPVQIHRAPLGGLHDHGRGRAGRVWPARQPHAASGRPGRRRAGTTSALALQPGQRLPHPALQHQQRRAGR
jgi:predicted RND superfamily exporter protein